MRVNRLAEIGGKTMQIEIKQFNSLSEKKGTTGWNRGNGARYFNSTAPVASHGESECVRSTPFPRVNPRNADIWTGDGWRKGPLGVQRWSWPQDWRGTRTVHEILLLDR